MIRTLLVIFMVSSSVVAEGPFGVSAGSTLGDIGAVNSEPGSNGFIKLTSVPKPHPDLFDYQVKLNAAGKVLSVVR